MRIPGTEFGCQAWQPASLEARKFLVFETGLLVALPGPELSSVANQAGVKLTEIYLPLPPNCCIDSMCHHVQHRWANLEATFLPIHPCTQKPPAKS